MLYILFSNVSLYVLSWILGLGRADVCCGIIPILYDFSSGLWPNFIQLCSSTHRVDTWCFLLNFQQEAWGGVHIVLHFVALYPIIFYWTTPHCFLFSEFVRSGRYVCRGTWLLLFRQVVVYIFRIIGLVRFCAGRHHSLACERSSCLLMLHIYRKWVCKLCVGSHQGYGSALSFTMRFPGLFLCLFGLFFIPCVTYGLCCRFIDRPIVGWHVGMVLHFGLCICHTFCSDPCHFHISSIRDGTFRCRWVLMGNTFIRSHA